MSQPSFMDRSMERVYSLTNGIGLKRAIVSVAGDRFDEESGAFVPNVALQLALTERYEREMEEFAARGGM